MAKRYVLIDDSVSNDNDVVLELGPTLVIGVDTPDSSNSEFLKDYADEVKQTVLISSWLSNDGYKDIYSEGILVPCSISSSIKNILDVKGAAVTSTSQISVDGAVIIGYRDKITFDERSPKILQIRKEYDIENASTIYSKTIFT